MRLDEIKATPILFKDAYAALHSHYQLERIGGAARVYSVKGNPGVVFLVNHGPKAVGLSWKSGSKALSKVYVWTHFNIGHAPDVVLDIPNEAFSEDTLMSIIDFVHTPRLGVIGTIKEDTDPVIPPGHTLHLVSRSAKGEMFIIPGMDRVLNTLEKQLSSEGGEAAAMEEQYEKLREKVKLVASGESSFIKSLLITGAPSSGKTHTVMTTIREMGLEEGKDYVVKKGSITDVAAYRTFIEQIDGMIIFDDCDSVVKTTDGKNMLKNALDTYPVRDINRDNANGINTAVMPEKERMAFVDAMSKVLRGVATNEDLSHFERFAVKKGAKAVSSGKSPVVDVDEHGQIVITDGDDELESLDGGSRTERMHDLQAYFARHLPNKIDFRGRVIFISNMEEDEWDSAILTRSFRQNMSFADSEMIDFIDRIKDHIPAPKLTSAQKQEVLDYLRHLHDSGLLKSRINFRLVQQCFDLRLTGPWKMMIASL